MPDHLTRSDIEAFYSRKASSLKLGYFARHLSTCLACRSLYDDVTAQGQLTGGLTFYLSEASGLWSEHPQYEDKTAYANNALDTEEREIVDDHLARCMECSEAFSAFAAARVEDDAELGSTFSQFCSQEKRKLVRTIPLRKPQEWPITCSGCNVVRGIGFSAYLLGITHQSCIITFDDPKARLYNGSLSQHHRCRRRR